MGDGMGKKLGWTIGKTRGVLYQSARLLGDINAVERGTVPQRLVSRGLGFLTGTLLGKIMRTIFGGRR